MDAGNDVDNLNVAKWLKNFQLIQRIEASLVHIEGKSRYGRNQDLVAWGGGLHGGSVGLIG